MNAKSAAVETIPAINPATREVIREIPVIQPSDVAGIVAHAREAQIKWQAIGIRGRLTYFKKIHNYLIKNADEIARIVTLDNGKPLAESLNAEVMPVLDMLTFCAAEAPRILRDEPISSPLLKLSRTKARNIFEPLGVVAIIAPWNFPFAISTTQILMALVTGNTVVYKPAALASYIGEAIDNIFREAGFPEGVFTTLQGRGRLIGDAIMESGVNRVAFTGSVPVGKGLMKKASETLTPITLELGGKDPILILDDADLDRASSGAVWGAFVNAGQFCGSVERVYVHKAAAPKFIDLVVEKTKKLRVGNGLDYDIDMGPLIDQGQIDIVEEHINDALAKGAKIAAGGKRIESLPGFFFEPTVLLDTDHSMLCMTEETFGPTMPITVVDDVEEAIRLANDSKYALTAGVWSANIRKADSICKRLVAGTTFINDHGFSYGISQCPWGGPKESGIGRTHGAHGLLEFTNMKNIVSTRPLLTENPWWHPYSKSRYDNLKKLGFAFYNARQTITSCTSGK